MGLHPFTPTWVPGTLRLHGATAQQRTRWLGVSVAGVLPRNRATLPKRFNFLHLVPHIRVTRKGLPGDDNVHPGGPP